MSEDGNGLSAELKGWLDNVVVPALVRAYLAEMEREKSACSEGEPVAECLPQSTVSSEGHG